MRQPSTIAQLFAWWREALQNPGLEREEGFPQCGFYRLRLTKGGPWVAARIWCEREVDLDTMELAGPEVLCCEVGGERVDPLRHWIFMTPVTKAEHDALRDRAMEIPSMAATMARVDLTAGAMQP